MRRSHHMRSGHLDQSYMKQQMLNIRPQSSNIQLLNDYEQDGHLLHVSRASSVVGASWAEQFS